MKTIHFWPIHINNYLDISIPLELHIFNILLAFQIGPVLQCTVFSFDPNHLLHI